MLAYCWWLVGEAAAASSVCDDHDACDHTYWSLPCAGRSHDEWIRKLEISHTCHPVPINPVTVVLLYIKFDFIFLYLPPTTVLHSRVRAKMRDFNIKNSNLANTVRGLKIVIGRVPSTFNDWQNQNCYFLALMAGMSTLS